MSPNLEDQITLSHTPTHSSTSPPLHILFITGNPGLIEYYRPFLTLLFTSLRNTYPTQPLQISGSSLLGFHTNSSLDTHGPYDLEDQIEFIGTKLGSCKQGKVVLVGHSVGAYILLEVLRRWKCDGRVQGTEVVAGVCLFPTVTHIAKSPSGRKFSLLCNIPYLPILAGLFVRALLSWLPFSVLQALVGVITGFPSHAAKTTTAFLKTAQGVRQALYLATHEMHTITTDNWDEELWGVTAQQTSNNSTEKTKLYFYFGTGDHWVADETRDELIAARAAKGGDGVEGPVMEIDEGETPHGFCIKHNEIVARKVVGYVREVMG